MTALIGGALLLISASALALIFGWVTAESGLLWTSIVTSVAAGILLALGYSRSRQELRRAPTEDDVEG